jgi:hypothetical protein
MAARGRKPTVKRPAGTAAADADAAGAGTGIVQSDAGVSGRQGAALTATDAQHQTDVNVPELMTGLNGLVQANAVSLTRALDQVTIQTANQNQFFNAVLNQMTTDHRDQMHNFQTNIDEQAVAVAALYARLIERLNNPTPPAQ